jgi:cytochrome c55X
MNAFWLLPFSAVTAAGVAASDVPAARQQQLHDLVVQDCGSCHGLTLKGGLGKPLLPETLAPFPEDVIAAIILDGVAGTPMPAWRGLLDETDARWIARELKQGLQK